MCETQKVYFLLCLSHQIGSDTVIRPSKCEKMQVEVRAGPLFGNYPLTDEYQLGYFIAHLGIVGGDKDVIGSAELLRKELLDAIQTVEKALDVAPHSTWLQILDEAIA